ncbi:MAG: glycosyltransferase family 9 protein [bacterium]
MDKVELFKKVDNIIGTPICFLLGVLDKIFFRKKSPPSDYKRILVIKLIAIGDLVVALPTIKALKKSFPEAYLAMLVTPRVKEVVEGFPYLDKIIYYDILGKDKGIKGLFKIISLLKKEKFDLVIELDHYYRITSMITFFARIKNRVGFDLPKQGRRGLVTIKVPYLVDVHEVEAFLETARGVGADISDKELVEIWTSNEDKEYVDKFLKEAGVTDEDFLVGIHPGTGPSATSRRWTPEKFGKLADWLIKEKKAKVVFTGANSELGLINESVNSMTSKPIIAAGKINLKQFAQLCSRCKLFICVDTGPLHIAAAMKTKVIGLYGPNTPLKWGPYGKGHITIYKNLDCSPCTKQYLGQVSKCKNPICMEKIEIEDVMKAVEKMLLDINKTR